MRLEIIKGAINTLKTEECINRIKDIRENESESSVIFVVPEQFSYSAEKLFSKNFGGTGLNNIEVVTLSRLCERYLNRAKKNRLTASGKAVLIQKAVNDVNKEENIYSGSSEKPGFVNTLSDIITELKSSLITPDMLLECAENTENEMLCNKLLSLAEFYSRYSELNNGTFYDSEEDMTRLANMIEDEGIFSNTYVFVDHYYEFYPQHYRVLKSILKTAKSLVVTLPYDDGDRELYRISRNTLARLEGMAKELKAPMFEMTAEEREDYFNSEELKFFFENYNKFNSTKFKPYEKNTKDISVYAARDPYTEIENAAKKIKWLVDEKNYRYRDISLCCGNIEDYLNIIEAVFSQYGIKYFTDAKLSVAEHPIMQTVISLFDILSENWSYDSVFRYLKSGYIYKRDSKNEVSGFCKDDIDLLDSYVLKYGIKGKKKWLSEDAWGVGVSNISDALSDHTREGEKEKLEKIEEIRREITKPIGHFIEKTRGRNTVENIAKALFEFLEEINLYSGLCDEVIKLNENGMPNEALKLSQIWNLFVSVLDQVVTALKDTKCSREEFKKYIYAALSANEISIIPPTQDSVSISSANTVGNELPRVIFVVGAIRGAVPFEKNDEGMLSDSDRNELDNLLAVYQCPIGGDTAYLRANEEYKFYNVLFSARDSLNISYPMNNFNGEAQMPAQIISDLKRIFKNLKKERFTQNSEDKLDMFFTVNSAFDYLLKNRNNKNDKKAQAIYEWFLKNDKEKLNVIKTADEYKIQRAKITPKNAELLYSEMLDYSASRLKIYADCPFKYFLQYGLGAKPEEIWQIQKFDLGTLMHYIVCEYCHTVENNAKSFEELRQNWQSLTDEKSSEIIDNIVDDVTKTIISSVGKEEDKIRYLLLRIKRIIEESVEIVRKSLTKGEYAAVEFEKHFLIKLNYEDSEVGIKGTIDRIDMAMDKNGAGLRVIDYKSGKKDFSIVSVCNMQDIQLVLYATAATELFKTGNIKYSDAETKSRITAIMYNKLKSNLVEANGMNSAQIEEKRQKEMKLNGVVVLDSTQDKKDKEIYDISDAFLMDKDIVDRQKSSYMKFELKNDGQPKSTSELMGRESFDKMCEYVNRKIIKTDREIRNGNIEILPTAEKNASACDYCDMREVCLFDKKRDNTRTLCKNSEEAWELIEKELRE